MFGPDDDDDDGDDYDDDDAWDHMEDDDLVKLVEDDTVESFIAAEADLTHAREHVHKRLSFQHATVMEFYGRGKIVEEANSNLRSLNVKKALMLVIVVLSDPAMPHGISIAKKIAGWRVT